MFVAQGEVIWMKYLVDCALARFSFKDNDFLT